MTEPAAKKERKPRTQDVTLAKIPKKFQGMDCYCALDKTSDDALASRENFIASIPVDGRSLPQNALWAVWYVLIGKEDGQSPDEVKRQCKLIFGIPIKCAGDKGFNKMWHSLYAPLSYEQQLYLMRHMKVTSEFSKGQGVEYQAAMVLEYDERGIVLKVL